MTCHVYGGPGRLPRQYNQYFFVLMMWQLAKLWQMLVAAHYVKEHSCKHVDRMLNSSLYYQFSYK